MENDTERPNIQLHAWWVLWFAFQTGVFVMYHFLGPKGSGVEVRPDQLPWVLGAIPVLVSAVIRWVVLPRIHDPVKAFPLFIIGIAMAEASLFLGLFIFPAHHRDLFILSVLGILQFIPLFARRFYPAAEGSRSGQ